MNRVKAEITDIYESDRITYVKLQAADTQLTMIKSKPMEFAKKGDAVHCVFQEASVSVSKECPGKISIENRIPAKLVTARKGESLCELTFESDIGKVVSLITLRANDMLELCEGCEATMLIRGTDINVEPVLDPIDTSIYEKVISRTKNAN